MSRPSFAPRLLLAAALALLPMAAQADLPGKHP